MRDWPILIVHVPVLHFVSSHPVIYCIFTFDFKACNLYSPLSFHVWWCRGRQAFYFNRKPYGSFTLFPVAIQGKTCEFLFSTILYYWICLLLSKCLETKPVERRGNVYYLKYVLLVRKVKDHYLEVEDIQDWNLVRIFTSESLYFILFYNVIRYCL